MPHAGKDHGWQPDGITAGSLQLIRSGADYDIVYTDTQGTRSAKGDGFTLLDVPQRSAANQLIIALSPQGTLEHYLFQFKDDGSGKVVWGTVRGAGLLGAKSSLMVAECRRSR